MCETSDCWSTESEWYFDLCQSGRNKGISARRMYEPGVKLTFSFFFFKIIFRWCGPCETQSESSSRPFPLWMVVFRTRFASLFIRSPSGTARVCQFNVITYYMVKHIHVFLKKWNFTVKMKKVKKKTNFTLSKFAMPKDYVRGTRKFAFLSRN